MDPITRQFVFGGIVPVLIALIALPCHAPHAQTEDRIRLRWTSFRFPLLFAVVVLLGFLGTLTTWRGEDWQEVLLRVPIAAGVIGILMAFTPRWWSLRLMLFLMLTLVVTAAAWTMFHEGDPWLPMMILPAGVFLLMAGLEPLAVRRGGPILPLTLWIAAGSSAAVVLLSGDMSVGVPYGTLAPAIFICAIFSFFSHRPLLADGALAVIVPMLVVIPTMRWLYMTAAGDALPVWAFVLPSIAPLAVWAGEIPFLRQKSGRVRIPIIIAIVAVLCGTAVGLTFVEGDDSAPADPLEQMYMEMGQ